MSPKEKLARLIQDRRLELQIRTARELASRANLSERLINEIENARRESYSPATLLSLDSVLSWEPGSCKAVLNGGDPEPIGDDRVIAEADCSVMSGYSEFAQTINELSEVVRSHDLNRMADFSLASKMMILSSIFGTAMSGYDLLTKTESNLILRFTSLTFEQQTYNYLRGHEEFYNEPQPHGFTRAEVYEEMRNGGTEFEAIQRLGEKDINDLDTYSYPENFEHLPIPAMDEPYDPMSEADQ